MWDQRSTLGVTLFSETRLLRQDGPARVPTSPAHRVIDKNQCFPSDVWVSGIKLGSSGFAADIFAH